MGEGIRSIHIWKTGGITPVPISVNVSRSHVYQKSFAGVLEKLAQQYDVEPYYVPLEVTESMFTEYVDKLYKNYYKASECYGFPTFPWMTLVQAIPL